MPHYNDGTAVQVGDIARGKGSNHSYPVQGVVVGVTPSATSCNLKIAIAKPAPFATNPAYITQTNPETFNAMRFTAGLAALPNGDLLPYGTELEYGTCADFELVHRPEAKANGMRL
jgi:hypothetical protein